MISSSKTKLIAKAAVAGLKSVIGGTNITIDNTDPRNPIINCTADDIKIVANYSALPAANTVTGQFYWCSASQGTKWLPGSLGGTYYSAGLYYSNGTTWEFLDVPYQATQAEVNAGTVTDKFVTPSTFQNSSQLADKASLTQNNTFTGTQDFQNDVTFTSNAYFNLLAYFKATGARIYNPANTFFYTFNASAIAGNRSITLPLLTGADTMVTANFAQTLTNKTLDNSNILTVRDDRFTLQDNGDTTKQLLFELSGITTANTRTLTVPDASTTILGRTGTNAANQLSYFSDANQVTSNSNLIGNSFGIGIGATPTSANVLNIVTSQNDASTIILANNTSGSVAQSRFIMQNSSGDVSQFGVFSAARTAVGAITGRNAYVYGSFGLVIWTAGTMTFAYGGGAAAGANFNSNGRFFIGGSTSASALLHLAAGTASASTAPLKFTSGTLLATPEVGAMEFNSDALYFTITTGAARKQIAFVGGAGTSSILAYVAKTANYTLTASDYTVDCTANSFTLTLPTAVGVTGQTYNLKNSGAGTITVNTTSSQTIDGLLTQTINPSESFTVQSTGSNWIII